MTGGLDPNLAFRLFFKDPDWRFKSGIGGVITASAFLLFVLNPLSIPLAFCCFGLLIGYNLRLIRSKIKDMNAPLPNWNDWLDLLISGLTWIAVLFGQSLIPISVVTIALMLGGGRGSRYVLSDEYQIWVVVSIAAISISLIGVSFISTLIMTNFAKKENMAAAFDLYTVGQKLRQVPAPLVQAWLISVGLQWLAVLLPSASVIGLVFIPIVFFVANSISAIILAQAWNSEAAKTD